MRLGCQLSVASCRLLRFVCVNLAILLSLSANPVQAQTTAFASKAHPFANLPGQPQGLTVMGGELYVHAADVMMMALRQKNDIVGFVVDTDFVKIDNEINYMVRQPITGDIYYTRLDRKGRSCLYVSTRDGKRQRVKRVKMDDVEVEHPTFSADGMIMVFSSMEKRRSYGGYDLWYSRFLDGEWSRPFNLGDRVNSTGDEVGAWVVGDYLFFSSNGHEDSKGHMNIYVTRLIADHTTGDTVGLMQIGRSRVQHLPFGINSAVSDCYDFVYDKEHKCYYWINSSSGFRSYNGHLEAVTLWGHIYNSRNEAMNGVLVTAYDGEEAVATAASDATGLYRICLPAGHTYRVLFNQANHYNHDYLLTARADIAGNLIGDIQHDVTLDALPVGRQFYYTDLFGPDAVIDLSTHGVEVLDPLVRFLTDNRALSAEMTLTCDLTDDVEFNSLLTEQRLKVVGDYLSDRLPATTRLTLRNGCNGRAGCSDATGETRLTILLK